MSTLLEQAKAVTIKARTAANISTEVVELALAWARGEVKLNQICEVTKLSGSSAYVALARGLRAAIQNGDIKVRSEKKEQDDA